jgi:ABC-type multidrug transport system fused ATPase/permease subunit
MTLLVLVALRTNGDNMPLLLARLLPFLYVLLRLVPLLKVLNGLRAELIGQWPQVGALAELLRLEDKGFLVDGRRPFAPLTAGIELRDVTLVYEGQPRPALDGVSFRIPAGQTTAIIGESGAGKSTVAALLLRLVDPTAGAVLLDGTPLTEFRLASYHAAIGVVSQDTFLFNDTVRFNIAFGASGEADDAEVIDAARQAGAHDFIMELANGYDTPLGDRGVRLSGGQRQRIAIARAIIRRPQILILDEATSSLDTATERRIHDALRELSRNRTVVIIAHRLSTIEDADWLVELGHGRVLRAVPNDRKSKVAGQEDSNIARIRHS